MGNKATFASLPCDDVYGLPVDVARTRAVSGLLSKIGTADDNATVVTTLPAEVSFIHATNINSLPVYLKLYNKATTPAYTDTPIYRALIPGGTQGVGSQCVVVPPRSIPFTTALSLRLSKGSTDAATTVPIAGDVLLNIGYDQLR